MRCRQWSHTRWTDSTLGCLNGVRLILQTLTHTKNFPLAITDGTNSQQLPRRVKVCLSVRDCKSAARVHRRVQPDSSTTYSLFFAQMPLQEEPSLARRAGAAKEGVYFSFLVLFVGNVLYNLGNRK